MITLPILDLRNDSPEVQAKTIREALGTVGFFEVRNSNLEANEIETIFELAKEVFAQPQDVKESFAADAIGSGYYGPHQQALGLYKRDNKEALLYGRQTAHREQPLPPPFTPGSPAQSTLKKFYKDCHSTSEQLLELFALALELPFAHFRRAHSFGENTATSLIHYPPVPPGDQGRAVKSDIRSGEHKDWGTLTMLFQMPDGQPGLQVYLPRAAVPDAEPVDTNHNSEYTFEGEWGWYNAPIPPPGGFLINVGLAMELWSGGAYKATLHRVVFPPAKEGEGLQGRYSVTYFVQPDDQVEIRPVLQGGANVKEGEPVTSKDLFGGKLKESLERIKNMPERSA
ncbi:hypothetical protein DB88DRAFT_508775 [Papiliotrema laurentii]|uniref:Fe2OG dioxygenase domain-containing protein n=1 Tax=Papiliotrema laurentii TaxID=5418 RepID=A0AAD9FUT9_PAPLA|nr:hypothetical protein DB88DRAFT_508775 [Papiliotrema laurentii]